MDNTSNTQRLLIYVAGLGLVLFGCSRPYQPAGLEGYFEDGPRILKYGAVDRLKAGQTWRVFVAAEDPKGDMEAIVFELYQPGQGAYPEHDRKLRGEETRAFAGYFYLNTPALWREGLWGLTLTLKFKVRDRVGYMSEVVSLPLKFIGTRVEQPIPEGFTEDEVRPLGAILIDIYREDKREGFGWPLR